MHVEVDGQGFAQEWSSPFREIRKRDGRVVPFRIEKIVAALLKAGAATGEFDEGVARRLAWRALAVAQATPPEGATPNVEGIQDCVEDALLASTFKRTAKAYILYRDQHAHIREITAAADVARVDGYLEQLDWRVRENSNMAFSLQGLNNYVAAEVSKQYWLDRIYAPELREAHRSGDLHVHDLSQLSVYCVGWDLRDLLCTGFRGARGKAESAPARHFRSALGQIVNFFYTLQGEAAGAQAFSSLDTLLAPFIRHDRLGYTEVRQALQEFVFNLNVPTRVGFQTPFTNVTLDLRPPANLAAEAAIVGGEPTDESYGEFQAEMDLFNRAFLEVMAQGDACGRVFTFPIPTYNITPDFDWDDENLSELWRVTARYGIPYFANFVNSSMKPEDARSMCCRLRLDLRTLERRGGGLFGANPLTGSIGVVTINMPRLGHLASDEADFLRRLDGLIEVAAASLETKRKVLESFTDKGLYPYVRFYLRDVKKRFGHYWDNHFSTIGLVGLNEACLNLFGQDIGSPAGAEFAGRVLDFMRDRLAVLQQRTGCLYNLEATPAEGAGYRLARLDRDRHPDMAVAAAAAGAVPLYTNSSQLPVDYTDDVFDVLERQDGLQCRYTGGKVLHVFVGEATPDPASVKDFVRTVCERYRLPYFTVTPTFSICPDHGYLPGEQPRCPRCGAHAEVYSRVVGYLRPVDQWNEGKQVEFGARRVFTLA
jgi:ribonucleoside-triphosphate reductase